MKRVYKSEKSGEKRFVLKLFVKDHYKTQNSKQ
jgi:hypothetical protein